MSRECWVDVAGFPGYTVSSLGRVRNPKDVVLMSRSHGNFPRVSFCIDGRPKHVRLALIVAHAFLAVRPKRTRIGYVDGDPWNCAARNLEYLTTREYDERRFWAKVQKGGLDDCWVWTAGVDKDGYGKFTSGRAHRASWVFAGKKPVRWILHSCDNPPCVNPAHLYDGSATDNAQDRSRRGRNRNQCGERNNMAKLTDAQVVAIRRVPQRRGVGRLLAKQYGVSYALISLIRSGKIR